MIEFDTTNGYLHERSESLSESNGTRLSRLSMRTMLAPAGVMPMKSDAFAKKRVRPSEAHSTAFHALDDVVASSSVPKGD
jgi:hypothetical protein